MRIEGKKSKLSPSNQENRIADRLGGKRVAGSGASMYSKADVRDVVCSYDITLLMECKQTKNASISIKWDWLKKISNQAIEQQCHPALAIEIHGGIDDYATDRDWILVQASTLKKLIDECKS